MWKWKKVRRAKIVMPIIKMKIQKARWTKFSPKILKVSRVALLTIPRATTRLLGAGGSA